VYHRVQTLDGVLITRSYVTPLWMQERSLHTVSVVTSLTTEILSFLISTHSYLAVAKRNFLPSYMFLLAIDTKCKYWQWGLSFEISCYSLWNLEAIMSTNWIPKHRNPEYVVACLWRRPESKKVETKHKLEQMYIETVVESVVAGIYYRIVRNTRNIRHDYCNSVECKCLPRWLNRLLRILTTKKRRIMFIIFLNKTKCTYDKTSWRLRPTIVAVETQQRILCVTQTHISVYYVTIECCTSMLLGQIYFADNNKTYLGLHVKCLIFLLNLNQTRIFPTYFRKILKYQISWKSFQWERSCSIWRNREVDRRMDRHDKVHGRFSQFFWKRLTMNASLQPLFKLLKA
jgi:hypothetical protein